MANVKLIFQGTETTKTDHYELECFCNTHNEITITLSDGYQEYPTLISLDVPTAIKFAKVLRAEINKVKEVDNG